MYKYLFFFCFSLLFCQRLKAQKTDTVLYFLKDNGDIATDRNTADYFIAVLPPDSTDANLFIVNEYYANGKIKLISKSTVNTLPLHFQGRCIAFFQNGHKRYTTNYADGSVFGDVNAYYPNGKPYTTENYAYAGRDVKPTYIECRDSTGNILCTGGNGRWIAFDKDFKQIARGAMVKGREDGTWEGNKDDSIRYTCVFKKGEIKTGIGYDKSGKAYTFKKLMVLPSFGHGVDEFHNFITRSEHYPDYARQHNLHETVQISFIVQKDGSVTDVKVVHGHIPCLMEEAVRVVSSSPSWAPGQLYGITEPITLNVNVYL